MATHYTRKQINQIAELLHDVKPNFARMDEIRFGAAYSQWSKTLRNFVGLFLEDNEHYRGVEFYRIANDGITLIDLEGAPYG